MTALAGEETVTEGTAPWEPFAVTCCTGGCWTTWFSRYSYARAYADAIDAGFRHDATGQLRCPACVAARLPSPGLYLTGADLTAWLDSQLTRDDLTAAPVVTQEPPVADEAPGQPETEQLAAVSDHPWQDQMAAALAPEALRAPAPEVEPEAEDEALRRFNEAHDALPADDDEDGAR